MSAIETRNEEAGFVEFINSDVPYIVRDIDGRVAILSDMETRQIIGYRVYEPAPLPTDGAAAPQFVRCDGCDGHECTDECKYPGVATAVRDQAVLDFIDDWAPEGDERSMHRDIEMLLSLFAHPPKPQAATDAMIDAAWSAYAQAEWDAGRAKNGFNRDSFRIALEAALAASQSEETR